MDIGSGTNNSNETGSNSGSDTQVPAIGTPPANVSSFPPIVEDEEYVEKRLPWSIEDDRRLARAWISISNDCVVGNSQSEKAFWKRISEYFNANRGNDAPRKVKAIKNHWYWLLPLVNEFNQIFNKLKAEHRSGWSDDQVKEHARELFFQNRRKHFTHEHVWTLLKDEPKWRMNSPLPHSSKRTKNNESGLIRVRIQMWRRIPTTMRFDQWAKRR